MSFESPQPVDTYAKVGTIVNHQTVECIFDLDTFPERLWILQNSENGKHGLCSIDYYGCRIETLACFTNENSAILFTDTLRLPSGNQMGRILPTLVTFEDAREIAKAKQTVRLDAIAILDKLSDPIVHFIR